MESYPLCQLFSQPGSGHEPALFFHSRGRRSIHPWMGASRERIEPIGDRQATCRTPAGEDRHEIDRGHEFVYFDHCGEFERASNGGDTPLSACFGLSALVCPCVAELIMQFADLQHSAGLAA
jgi:hypothetical protein